MAKTRFANQILHSAPEPLDSTLQVARFEDLNDFSQIAPYVGKVVHVINEHKLYICAAIDPNTDEGIWRPFIDETATEFYLTAPDGRVLTLRAVIDEDDASKLRLETEYQSL